MHESLLQGWERTISTKPAAPFSKAHVLFRKHSDSDGLICIAQFGELEHLQKCFSESHECALGTVHEMCYKRALFLLVLHIKTPYFIEISKCLSLFPQFKIIDSWLFTLLTPSSPHTQSTIEIRHLFYGLLLISVVIHTVQQEHSILRTPKLSLVLSTIR